MTERSRTDEPDGAGAAPLSVGRSWSLSATVSPPLTTVHLPPERAVLTTPAMIGLMERCIAEAEGTSGRGNWQSRAVEVRHRAGLRLGEGLTATAELDQVLAEEIRWRTRVESSDGMMIGDGMIVRVRS